MSCFLMFVLFAIHVIAQQDGDTWLPVGTLVGLSVYAFVFSFLLHFIPQTGLHVYGFYSLDLLRKGCMLGTYDFAPPSLCSHGRCLCIFLCGWVKWFLACVSIVSQLVSQLVSVCR